ncbi:MAG: SulP family inorganic anion transporter [Micavibrio sp.]|nr:SulP family inorganic anion transporter [Micavibrio sp.]
MPPIKDSFFSHWRQDLPASVVVFLVALPLCLGIAMASGAPLFSGLIAGMVGGIVIGTISKSPLSVSGPAAGLTVIVLDALQTLPTFETFLLATCLAGVFQVIFGALRAGIIGDFIPNAIIKGMLAAIGIILILKQIPHAFGYDANHEGDEAFLQTDGHNSFSALVELLRHDISYGAVVISLTSLGFLFFWDKTQPKLKNFARYIPGPLVVVAFGIGMNWLYGRIFPSLQLEGGHLVTVPVSHNAGEFFSNFTLPDFSAITNPAVWTIALTLAVIASLETLLSIEAIDKLDTYKRVTPTNRELLAQGAGNIASGLIGGLPVTSVIVRSSANASAGAHGRLSAVAHGSLLLLSIVLVPVFLNLIPLSALAAILISTGYKLAKPQVFRAKFQKGWGQFISFIVTIAAILLTDLLIGIGIGMVVGLAFIVLENFRSSILLMVDGNNYLLRCKKDLFFINKYELKKWLAAIPDDANVLIDVSRVSFIDRDNVDLLSDFMESATYRGITARFKTSPDNPATLHLKAA